MKECFFCKIQKQDDEKKVVENEDFFSRYDDFLISAGHCEIISKQHVVSFFELNLQQLQNLYELLNKTKQIVQKKFNPNGFNIGINEGEAAGRTIDHLHIHLIPRYKNDVPNPAGGVRNVIPEKCDYTKFIKK